MTKPDEYYKKDCDKIDAKCVNAFFELELEPTNPSILKSVSSWGENEVDLAPAVKDAETMTYLKLYPENDPTYLAYYAEDEVPQCIYGEDLARIIPMTKLKDVNQSVEPVDGEVYIYNGTTDLFEPFDLMAFITDAETRISSLENRTNSLDSTVGGVTNQIQSLLNAISQLQTTVNNLSTTLTKPQGIPSDATVAWGNRNIYADYTNSSSKSHGIFTHDTSTNMADDQYFA